MREGYKKSPVGEIPSDWILKTIGDEVKFEGGAQPPKEYFINEEKEGYIRLIQIRDYKTDNYLTYIPIDMARKFCTEDDIMIGRYGPPIFQILKGIKGAYNVALLKAIPNEKILNKEYTRYFLSTEKLFKLIDRLSQRTSGQTGVDMEALNNYLIPIPPLKEQEEIVAVLSTVDSQIGDTEKLIEKSKELKKGLMQKLLTKGIGHSEFKKTEIAEIPVSWEVVTFETLYEEKIRDFGSFSTTKLIEYVDEGIPYLRSENFRENNLNYKTVSKIPQSVDDLLDKSYVYKDNILFTKIGNIGSAYCYKGELGERCNSNATIAKIKVDEQKAINEYIVYFLISDICKKQYIGDIVSTPPRINMGVINKFKIILPPLKEQEKISEILLSVDIEIKEYENKKQKLEELKKGLMQQLLTGKIRVVK